MKNVYRVVWLSDEEYASLSQLAVDRKSKMSLVVSFLVDSFGVENLLYDSPEDHQVRAFVSRDRPFRLGLSPDRWQRLKLMAAQWGLTVPETIRSLIASAWVDFTKEAKDREAEVLKERALKQTLESQR